MSPILLLPQNNTSKLLIVISVNWYIPIHCILTIIGSEGSKAPISSFFLVVAFGVFYFLLCFWIEYSIGGKWYNIWLLHRLLKTGNRCCGYESVMFHVLKKTQLVQKQESICIEVYFYVVKWNPCCNDASKECPSFMDQKGQRVATCKPSEPSYILLIANQFSGVVRFFRTVWAIHIDKLLSLTLLH